MYSEPTHVTPPADSRLAPTVLIEGNGAEEEECRPVGSLLDGRYRILDVRGGRGKTGMGVVYIVESEGVVYAAKTFQRRFSQDLDLVRRFIREAQTWMLIGFHPNVVRARGLDIIQSAPYLFMEFVPPDLGHRFSMADHLIEGAFPIPKALDFGIQFCEGMMHATRAIPGLVHRDIKPENLLVTPEGVLKITDFGLVRAKLSGEQSLAHYAHVAAPAAGSTAEEGPGLTQLGAIFGTPAYMAPEQFEHAASVTMAADIYAFGCCLYEWLVGNPPFVARAKSTYERVAALRRKHLEETPRPLTDRLEHCPEALNAVVMRCLEKAPGDRWAHFSELRESLARVLHDEYGQQPSQIPRVEPTPREVAEQARSLTLLEGYDQAIRMRSLREHQDSSPYSFHLALASYFHCENDPEEEQRQLEKAARAQQQEPGDEVARRLADLFLNQGAVLRAEEVLTEYLGKHPERLERVLEPWVLLLCEQGHYQDAHTCLEAFPESFRTRLLRARVLHAEGNYAGLCGLLVEMCEGLLDSLSAKIAGMTPDDIAGWAEPGDEERLQEALALLRPECDSSILNVIESVVWPDLSGDPDFSAEMAWLSQAAGALEALEAHAPAALRVPCRDVARLLDYPRRLRRYLEREEYWFWLQERLEG